MIDLLTPRPKQSRFRFALLSVALALPVAMQAQATRSQPSRASSATSTSSAQLARTLASELQRAAKLPGLSVAVAANGRIVFAEGVGHADVEARRPVTPATRFRTGSVAKVIAVTSLARLMESGAVDLDAPVQQYVPAFPAREGRVTPRLLAGHLAGIAHYTGQDRIERRFYPTMADALGVFSHVAPIAPPGQRYSYSTHGYTLLSAAIEGAARKPFLDHLRDAVLVPLGMRSTGPELSASPHMDEATPYSLSDSGPVRVMTPEDPSYKWAGGGMRSTPSDLVRMASAYTNDFLKPATVQTMFESQRLPSGDRTNVGIGWRSSVDMGGRRVVEHAGSMQGARAVVALFPEQRIAVSLMANAEWSSSIEESAHLIALAFLSPPASRPQPTGRYEISATLLGPRGDTTSSVGTLTLRRGGGTLELAAPVNGKSVILPLVYLDRGDTYALVRPDGLYHLTLTAGADTLTAQAAAYGSMRSTSPASNPPFLRIAGRRAASDRQGSLRQRP